MNDAVISADGRYRYLLRREIVPDSQLGLDGEYDPQVRRSVCLFCMLNPSTADAQADDQTIRKCVRFAGGWGYCDLEVVNLFALRSRDPGLLALASDPVGPANDTHILAAASRADLVVCAWGARGGAQRVGRVEHRAAAVRGLLRAGHAGKSQGTGGLVCVGLTKDGHPRHPLFVKGDSAPIAYA